MLKHTTPRSSPSLNLNITSQSNNNFDSALTTHSKNENETTNSSSSMQSQNFQKATNFGIFNERSVDCDGIMSKEPLLKKGTSIGGINLGSFFGDRLLNFGSGSGNGIGPVITHGKAIVRRGLSFNGKKDPDVVSIRSVKSEGQVSMKTESHHCDLPVKAISEAALETVTKLEIVDDFHHKMNVGNVNSNSKDKTEQPDETFKNCVFIKHDKQDNNVTIQSHFSKKIFGLSKTDHPSLKSLLRLPGVYGHIPVPEGAPSGSPHILNPDSLSLNSADSFLSSNSGRTSSRSWSSNTSSNSNNTSDSCNSNASSSSSELTSTTLKVFAKCLRSDIEYKTVNIGSKVTSRQLINLLLSKARMRHRDANLFYLTMEVTVRRWSGVPVRALLVLEDSARPAQLALCRPSGDLRFVLQMRRGGVIKVHDTVLMPGSQYKSLLVSYCTTAEETVQLLLNCCGRRESKHYFALHEVCQTPHYKDRRLGSSEKPLEVKAEWPKDRKAEFVFVLRRNMSQALSLRKLSTFPVEMKPDENKENYHGKALPSIGNSNSKAEILNLITKESIPIMQEGRIRGRSLSPIKSHSNVTDEAVIDCTCTTPVMTIVKSQIMPSNYESSNLNSDSHISLNNKSNYGENMTWSEVKNDETRFNGNVLSKFDITYPVTCYRRNAIKTQLKNPQKSVTFNLTNSVPISRKYTTNSLPKNQKAFHTIHNAAVSSTCQSKFLKTTNSFLEDLKTQPAITTNDKVSNALKIQQEKFAKALEKLNPHINDDGNDICWSNNKVPKNLFETCGSVTNKFSDNWHSEFNRQNFKAKEIQKSLNLECQLSSYKTESNSFTNSACINKSFSGKKNTYSTDSKNSVLSSAVQTELTCIPLKGLKNTTQKWNSVETLLDLRSLECNKIKDLTSLKTNTVENNSLQVTLKEDSKAGHQPGIHCEHNCKKCFYI